MECLGITNRRPCCAVTGADNHDPRHGLALGWAQDQSLDDPISGQETHIFLSCITLNRAYRPTAGQAYVLRGRDYRSMFGCKTKRQRLRSSVDANKWRSINDHYGGLSMIAHPLCFRSSQYSTCLMPEMLLDPIDEVAASSYLDEVQSQSNANCLTSSEKNMPVSSTAST